jgi:hypothetical protein
MKALSTNAMPKGAPGVPGSGDLAGKSNASIFAQRNNNSRPAWLEACELARRAGDDLESLADRLASVTGTPLVCVRPRANVAFHDERRTPVHAVSAPLRDWRSGPRAHGFGAFLGSQR